MKKQKTRVIERVREIDTLGLGHLGTDLEALFIYASTLAYSRFPIILLHLRKIEKQ